MSAFELQHECHIENIWHINEGRFSRGCWFCLFGGKPYPMWVDNVRVSDADRYRMELATIKGYTVVTDGDDLYVVDGDQVRLMSMVLSEYEWNSAREKTYE